MLYEVITDITDIDGGYLRWLDSPNFKELIDCISCIGY